jgi:UDP-N-acetyl-D-galactosamine dehydrogenase
MLAEADIIIVAVPTPVDEAHIPDFRPLIGSPAPASAAT